MPRRRNKTSSVNSTVECNFCHRKVNRIRQHLTYSPECSNFYDTNITPNNPYSNSSSSTNLPRRSQRNIEVNNFNEIENNHLQGHDFINQLLCNNVSTNTNSDQVNNRYNNVTDGELINPDGNLHSDEFDEDNDIILHFDDEEQVDNIDGNSTNVSNKYNDNNTPFDFISSCKSMITMKNTCAYSTKQLISLKLYDVIRRVNAPIILYDEMRALFDEAMHKLESSCPPYLSTRTRLIDDMEKKILNGSMPSSSKRKMKNANQIIVEDFYKFSLRHKVKKLRLMQTSVDVDVPVFDIVSEIVSMLSDPFLMKLSHTLYHKPMYQDPLSHNSEFFDDLETTQWFRKAHQFHINDSSSEMLCPLLFFIDGIRIDSYGRSSLEPVIFTLGLFKRKIRNLTAAWRLLGLIPNPQKTNSINYKKYKNGDDLKKIHYHQILECILEDLSELQKCGGIKWLFTFPDGTSKEFTLKFAIIFIIGDCMGHDKLCCRIQTYIPSKLKNTGACRDCNVIHLYCSDADFKCDPLSRDVIKNSTDLVLKYLSFYNVGINAFDNISLGGSLMGINGATPPEPLHQFWLGVVKFLIEYFLGHLTVTTVNFLNECVVNMCKNLSRQSDRHMPSIGVFQFGLDKIKLTGTEIGAQLFMIYITMLVTAHKNKIIEHESKARMRFKHVYITNPDKSKTKKRVYFSRLLNTNAKYNKWLGLFEDMISLGEWMSSTVSPISKDSVCNLNIEVNLWSLDNYDEWVNTISKDQNNDIPLVEEINDDTSINSSEIDDVIHFPDADYRDESSLDSSNIDQEQHQSENSFSEDGDTHDNHDTLFESLQVTQKTCFISKADYGIRVFMKTLKNLIHRDDWHRLLTLKFHQLLHIIRYIIEFGPPSNYNGGIPERVIKELAKHPGSHTQLRQISINLQAALHVAEDSIIAQALTLALETGQYSVQNGWSDYFSEKIINDTYANIDDEGKTEELSTDSMDVLKLTSKGHTSFSFELVNLTRPDYMSNLKLNKISITCEKKFISRRVPWNHQEMRMRIIVQTLYDCLRLNKEMNKSYSVSLFNTFSINGIKFNSSFDYCGEKSWFDWCRIQFNTGVFPGKIIAIIDGNKFMQELGIDRDSNCNVPDGDVWLVVQCVRVVNRTNTFCSSLSELYSMEDNFRIISVENITSTCFAIPNTKYTDSYDSSSSFLSPSERDNTIIMNKRHLWCECFMDKTEGLI
jgi:hypothetical protein